MEPPFVEITCSCGKVLRVSKEHMGKKAVCPACKTPHPILEVGKPAVSLPVESALPLLEEAPSAPTGTRPCPYCAESVQSAAIKCRHCGERLDGPPRARPPLAGRPGIQTQDQGGTGILVLGILSLALGGCGLVLGPIAWVMGNNYLKECRTRRAKPNGGAVAGRICGIIATILWAAVVAFYVIVFALVGIAGR